MSDCLCSSIKSTAVEKIEYSSCLCVCTVVMNERKQDGRVYYIVFFMSSMLAH